MRARTHTHTPQKPQKEKKLIRITKNKIEFTSQNRILHKCNYAELEVANRIR